MVIPEASRILIAGTLAAMAACASDGVDTLVQLKAEAMAGDADAQYLLGIRYQEGDGMRADSVEAARWFARAAAAGEPYSRYELGRIHHDRASADDQIQARALYEAALADGVEAARPALATLLASSPAVAVHDGTRAVALMEASVRNAIDASAEDFETLAAAYARAGRFAEAVGAERSAIALLRCDCPNRDDSEQERRLAAYLRGEAWVADSAP